MWIETACAVPDHDLSIVTSLAEVWIETRETWKGVKHGLVTSLAEVWIETALPQPQKGQDVSLPLRKCGLKPGLGILSFCVVMSLPLRKCGLKHVCLVSPVLVKSVTSLAEVWIETVPAVNL